MAQGLSAKVGQLEKAGRPGGRSAEEGRRGGEGASLGVTVIFLGLSFKG